MSSPGYHHSDLSNSLSRTPGGTSVDDDKGRGSYKCGRCGVPKKGHVCPYQPKVKRRPEEPLPEMKCVSTQVEMDEVSLVVALNQRHFDVNLNHVMAGRWYWMF